MIKPSRSSARMEALERRQMLSITGYDVQFIGYPNANTTGWSSSSQDPMGAYCLGPFGNQSVTYGSNGWAPHVELQISTGIRDDWIRPQSSSDRDDKVEILVDGLLLLTRWYQKDGNPNGLVFLSQELGPGVQDSGNGYWTIPHTGSFVGLTYTGSGLDTGSGDKMDITHLSIHITPPPTVSVTAPDNVATEDSPLDPTMTFRFQRTGNLSQSLTANYQLGGTAGLTQTGTVTFAANAATVDLLVSGGSDTTPEWTETVTATVTDSSNGQYLPAEGSAAVALAEIVDDDLNLVLGDEIVFVNNNDDNDNNVPDLEDSGLAVGDPDLVPVVLSVPQDMKYGATVMLSESGGLANVWDSQSKGNLVLSGPGSMTWIYGQEMPPTVLWVEAKAASATLNGLQLTLAATDATAQSAPIHATSTQASDQASAPQVTVKFQGNVVRDPLPRVLVGQGMNYSVEVTAPPEMEVGAKQWTLGGGETFKDYRADENTAVVDPVPADDLKRDTIHFYVNTSSGPYSVSCQLNVGGRAVTRTVKVNVIRPESTLKLTSIGTPDVDNANAWLWLKPPAAGQKEGAQFSGSVKTAAGFAPGRWRYVQRAKIGRRVTLGNGQEREAIKNHSGYLLDKNLPYSPDPLGPADQRGDQEAGESPFWNTGNDPHPATDYVRMGLELDPVVNVSKASIDETSLMYVMFLPPGADSQWVALKSLRWGWKEAVSYLPSGIQDIDIWKVDAGSAATTPEAAQDGQDIFTNPEWPGNAQPIEFQDVPPQ